MYSKQRAAALEFFPKFAKESFFLACVVTEISEKFSKEFKH